MPTGRAAQLVLTTQPLHHAGVRRRTVGTGKRIQLAQRFFRTDQIFAELIVLGLIGFAIDMGFRLLLRLSCKWAV